MKTDNELIAEFMGSRFYDEPITNNRVFYNIPSGIYELNKMKFDSSWDWLMPVLSKILDLSFQDDGDEEDFYSIRDCVPDINHTHKAVVEFIKLYNLNKIR
jgi:hypothetical protein